VADQDVVGLPYRHFVFFSCSFLGRLSAKHVLSTVFLWRACSRAGLQTIGDDWANRLQCRITATMQSWWRNSSDPVLLKPT
jgi:hypothetical protein